MEERIFVDAKSIKSSLIDFFLFHEHEQMLYLFVVLNILNLLDGCSYKVYHISTSCECCVYTHLVNVT